VVFSEEGSREVWHSRCRLPSCCGAGWHCIPLLGGKQGHEPPWLQSGEKQAAPHSQWTASKSWGLLPGCILPCCKGTERGSHPQLSSKYGKNSRLHLTYGSSRAPAFPADPAGQSQCFDDAERKGHLLSAHVYLPTSERASADNHIAMQSSRCNLDKWQEDYFKPLFLLKKWGV